MDDVVTKKKTENKESKMHTEKSMLKVNMFMISYTMRMQMHMKMDVFSVPYVT